MFAPMAAMNPVCRSVVDFDISIASGGQGESVKGYAKRYFTSAFSVHSENVMHAFTLWRQSSIQRVRPRNSESSSP